MPQKPRRNLMMKWLKPLLAWLCGETYAETYAAGLIDGCRAALYKNTVQFRRD